MLDIRQLQTFWTVAHAGSFAAAARELDFTPSAISQQIASLERVLGACLFVRMPRGVRLTDSGKTLLSHCEAVFARLRQAQVEVRDVVGGRVGRIRLGSFTSATSQFVAEAVRRFHVGHPQVSVELVDGEPYETALRLQSGDLDLAVMFEFPSWSVGTDYEGMPRADRRQLDILPLFEDPFQVIVPRSHRFAEQEEVEIGDLDDEPLLAGPPWLADLQHCCARAGAKPNFAPGSTGANSFAVRHAVGFEAFQALTAAGYGITFMPSLALGWLRSALVARPLKGGPVRHVGCAWAAEGERPAASAALLTAIVDAARQLPPVTGGAPSENLWPANRV